MEKINPKAQVEKLFKSAIDAEKHLSVVSKTDNTFEYWDEDGEYRRIYYFDDSIKSVAGRLLMDSPIESFLPKERLAAFLLTAMDPNSIMVLEKLVLLWDNEEGISPARDSLECEYGDEYAQYIANDNLLGQIWVERQIPVINVSAVYQSCKEIFIPDIDGSFSMFFMNGVLQTIFHECRHLFYECNEIVHIGQGTKYSWDGGIEEYVEEYGNDMADKYLKSFYDIVLKKPLEQLIKQRD